MVDNSRKERGDNHSNSGSDRNPELQAKFETLKTRYEAILSDPIPERLRDLVERIRAASSDRQGDER